MCRITAVFTPRIMYLMSTQGNIQIHSYSSQGMRRFTPTAAHPPWSGVLQAISYGPACPQQFPRQLDNVTAQQETMTRCRVSRVSRVTCLTTGSTGSTSPGCGTPSATRPRTVSTSTYSGIAKILSTVKYCDHLFKSKQWKCCTFTPSTPGHTTSATAARSLARRGVSGKVSRYSNKYLLRYSASTQQDR